MYDHLDMDRYSYPQYPAAAVQKHYPTAHATSSAFSASANPNEDWTKISDLAERRRIQNRIAQRNYRKKLKKRLEDLERRAGSSSASPEQRHEELPTTISDDSTTQRANAQRTRSLHGQSQRNRTPEVLAQQYVLPSEDRSMFSQQFTRQLSTSPPPFTVNAPIPPVDTVGYSTYSSYCAPGLDMAMYQSYGAPTQTYAIQNLMQPPIKQEVYADDEVNPFSMSYASMANEITSYQTQHHYTPSLSDSSEEWQAGSPPALSPPGLGY